MSESVPKIIVFPETERGFKGFIHVLKPTGVISAFIRSSTFSHKIFKSLVNLYTPLQLKTSFQQFKHSQYIKAVKVLIKHEYYLEKNMLKDLRDQNLCVH